MTSLLKMMTSYVTCRYCAWSLCDVRIGSSDGLGCGYGWECDGRNCGCDYDYDEIGCNGRDDRCFGSRLLHVCRMVAFCCYCFCCSFIFSSFLLSFFVLFVLSFLFFCLCVSSPLFPLSFVKFIFGKKEDLYVLFFPPVYK